MKEVIFNLVNGVRSGIPVCCILFFTYHAARGKQVALYAYEKRTGKIFDPREIIEGEAEYVQCGICAKRNRVEKIRSNGVIMKGLLGK